MNGYRLEFDPSEAYRVQDTMRSLNRYWVREYIGWSWASMYIELTEEELLIVKLTHNITDCTVNPV